MGDRYGTFSGKKEETASKRPIPRKSQIDRGLEERVFSTVSEVVVMSAQNIFRNVDAVIALFKA